MSNLNSIINSMSKQEQVSFLSSGKAQAVFSILKVMATTRPLDYRDVKLGDN